MASKVTSARLRMLSKDAADLIVRLRELCKRKDVLFSSTDGADELISKLLQKPLDLTDFKVDQLKNICREEGLHVGGNHADLVRRLIESDGTQGPARKKAKVDGAAPAAASNANDNMASSSQSQGATELTAARLCSQTLGTLKDQCKKMGIDLSAVPDERSMIAALLNTPLKLEDFAKYELELMCEAEGLPEIGSQKDLINLLRRAANFAAL